jgi:hypothetical protein
VATDQIPVIGGAQTPAHGHAVDLAAIPWGCAWALVDEFVVAAALGLSVRTIRNYRLNNVGPRFIRLNGCAVRYRLGDLQAFLEAQPSGGGTQLWRGPGRPRKAI